MNLTNANSTDRFRILDSEDNTDSINFNDLPNDNEKISYYKKQLENFIIKDDEEELDELSQIAPEKREYDPERYDSILLGATSAKAIIQIFEKNPCGLIKSDAKDKEFSIKSILERMKKGHKVYKYNYNTPARKIVTIQVNLNVIEIYKTEKSKTRVRFLDIFGITLGATSSTFRLNKQQIDYKFGAIHTSEDCFSVITEFRSFDFATSSHLARYDICLALSWLCTLNNSLQSIIPFTKRNHYSDYLAWKSGIDKIRFDARTKYLSICELFLVINN